MYENNKVHVWVFGVMHVSTNYEGHRCACSSL